MLRKPLILLLAAILVFKASLHSQPYFFRHYEVESGLSNNAVLCSVQDKMGFMWFATRDGVNRFDGYTFKVYRFNDKNETSGSNFISALHIDHSGSLLAATETDIYRYDPKSDSFNFVVSSRYFGIHQVISDDSGSIWFNAGLVLARFSERTKRLKIYEPSQFFQVSTMDIDNKGVLWVGTPDGQLKQYIDKEDNFKSFDLFQNPGKDHPTFVSTIECTDDDKILIGTNKAGFKIFDKKSLSYADIPLCCEKLDNLFIRVFLRVSPTECWIGTETGIFIYNSETGRSKKINKNSTDQLGISDNVIYSFCKDREGGIWVGTYFGGINYYPNQYTPFQKYYYKPFENSLSGNIVREMAQDDFGHLWIGTEDGGLNKIDSKTGKITYYKPGNSASNISYICAHTLLVDKDELWLGTYEHGLDIIDINTGKVVRHYGPSAKTGFKSNFPFCFFKTTQGKILVGTVNGVHIYNPIKDFFEPIPGFPSSGLYADILQDAGGTIWTSIIGKGIYYVNAATGKSGSFSLTASSNSLASNRVNSIFEDSKKTLWFATENGLCKLNRETGNFTRYGTDDGFPSNFMLAILEDSMGLLWISTTRGLARFDPRAKKVRVYTTANGILSDQFNFSSALKDKDGRMYFGSAKGLVSFHPDELSQDAFEPPVYLTGLQVNNQDIAIDGKFSPLKQSISYTDQITLNYDQSNFSLDFAALGYTAPQNLQFAYQLNGVSKDWTYIKGTRKVSFTKLQPGKYVFKVKASSSSGTWSDKETSLVIEILPPWWASNWAFAFYLAVTLLGIFYLLQRYHHHVEKKNLKKIELLEIAKEKEIMQLEIAKEKEIFQLEMAKEKEILESKIDFFTDVAHEIRTPLTLIKIPLAKVLRKSKDNPEVTQSLEVINRNTSRLIELTNQLLDFRQVEINKFQLSFNQVEIGKLVTDAGSSFATLAEQNNISLSVELPDTPLNAFIDVDAFNKIIYNLLSNAVKYADSKACISLLPYLKDNLSFTIQVTNDGHLIPENLKDKIFEPFYRIRESEMQTGTGIGLALSLSLAHMHNGDLSLAPSQNNMNVFSLTLPINNQTDIDINKNIPGSSDECIRDNYTYEADNSISGGQ